MPVLNGFVVTCGCQTVVFNDLDKMMAELREYYRNPGNTEKLYIAHKVNDTMDCPPPECNVAGQQCEAPPPTAPYRDPIERAMTRRDPRAEPGR